MTSMNPRPTKKSEKRKGKYTAPKLVPYHRTDLDPPKGKPVLKKRLRGGQTEEA